jgi:hypothetical protein
MEDDQVTIQVGFAVQGDLQSFPDGSPETYIACAGRKELEHLSGVLMVMEWSLLLFEKYELLRLRLTRKILESIYNLLF